MSVESVRHVSRRSSTEPLIPRLQPWEWNLIIVALVNLGTVQPTLKDQTDRLSALLAPLRDAP